MHFKQDITWATDSKIITPTPIQPIAHHEFKHNNIKCFIKRDDMINPLLSGNKWRKLKYNIELAKQDNKHTILSFGGAFSNHLYAVAGAGKLFNINTIGIIRGEYDPQNPNNIFLNKMGMKCIYVDRQTYRKRNNKEYLNQLAIKHQAFVIPEGGYSSAAMQGIIELTQELEEFDYDYIICAVGSGTTIAGLANYNPKKAQVIGIAAFDKAQYLNNNINELQLKFSNKIEPYQLIVDEEAGKFGSVSPAISEFTREFILKTNIPIEPIYTGKVLYVLRKLIHNKSIKANSRVLVVHTGGLQGLSGLEYRNVFKL